MTLNEQIEKDFIQAFKNKKEAEVLTLRMLKNAIKNTSIAQKAELKDEEIVKLIRSEIKKRTESIEAFEQGGRDDLASKEKAEMEILKAYLPKELSDEEINKVINQVIEETGASDPKEFGKVMGLAMKKLGGKAEGGRVTQLVKAQLERFS